MNISQTKAGFSLVEILIVLAIIAIVSALGLQGLERMRDDTRVNTVTSRLKQLDVAKEQYLSEWGRLQAASNWSNLSTSNARYNVLKRYIERPQYTLGDVVPDVNCTLYTPSTIYGRYSGAITLNSPYTVGNVKIHKISVTDH